MAGHSKWANIKHRKAAQDAKRGKVFTKIIRELVVAAREGGGNIDDNPRLRQIVDKALNANMKRDTIDKAIQRGVGAVDGEHYDRLLYEGYGPGGVAILVNCLTDNVNRTVSQVRSTLTKAGGNLGTTGSVAYLFENKGQLSFPEGIDEETIMDLALEAGADDIVTNDDYTTDVYTSPAEFIKVKDVLATAGFCGQGEITMIPVTTIALDKENAAQIMRLIEALEDLDDVQNVYSNADISEEVIDQID